jgi:TfoX/Sxy family transcriptional regulator of competence genes
MLVARADVSERKMFGGLAFMVAGNMACGVLGDDLIVRLGDEEGEKALAEDGVRPFDFTGRPMKNIVFVSPEQTADDAGLAEWVDAGADYASSLPPK